MTDPLEILRGKYWLNVYINDKPNAPICNLVLVDKENKDSKFKYPIWRDKEKEGYGYVGKLDVKQVDSHNQAKGNGYAPQDDDDFNNPPF
jgi:hypothetical protein